MPDATERPAPTRADRAGDTRELILAAAERLFAEHGVFAVSNRQIGEAAGQGNNFAVGYHFGSKAELVRTITRRHADIVERVRVRMLAEIGDSTDVRDWVACLVRPSTEHLDSLGSPTWYARFGAQVMTDPGLRRIVIEDSLATQPIQQVLDGLNRCLPSLPLSVHLERSAMARNLMSYTFAERERALAENTTTPRASWEDTATGLIDAIVGMWLAPVTTPTD
ncbi:TetR/AcrR family transcriptional regulator [Actinoalloteichus hymeniacidonis]|uniref:TetR/AcrR family transcriptional regulator n=1 Tax=Actinoalloteichus hymeniacidonis TaxID=340345 RepID=UPI000852FD07|nr:TetR/AcrR family transcriptional regulator [Actinoalloteichus hymeniacidonis]MBB5907894.1 AcrR family transcriptional regulator [Actinoalloteichus hymeniacidonis]